MLNKTELKENLSKFIAAVKFTKVDGTEREMRCTLMPSIVPEIKLEEAHLPRKQNDEVLAVWDLENEGWRSFRLDSIIDIQYIGVENAASA